MAYPTGLDQECTLHGSLVDEAYHQEQEQKDRDYCEGIRDIRVDTPTSSGAENDIKGIAPALVGLIKILLSAACIRQQTIN